jgi:hypothetical protein
LDPQLSINIQAHLIAHTSRAAACILHQQKCTFVCHAVLRRIALKKEKPALLFRIKKDNALF